MNPLLKYTLARLGLFVVAAAVLVVLPIPIHLTLRLGIAVLISAALSFFLLRGLRDEVAVHLTGAAKRRAERKEELRSALSGDDNR